MKRKNWLLGSSVSQSVSHGGVTDELTDPLRGGGEAGVSLAELAAVLGGGVIVLIALADFGRAALLRAQAEADAAAAQRAATEALVQIAQRDNITLNMIARTQAIAPILMWLAVLVAGLAVLAVIGLVAWSLRQRKQAALGYGPGYGQVTVESVGRLMPVPWYGNSLMRRLQARVREFEVERTW